MHNVGTDEAHKQIALLIGLDADWAFVVAVSNDWRSVARSCKSACSLGAGYLLPQRGSFLPEDFMICSLGGTDAFDCLPGGAGCVDGARLATEC